MMDRRAVIGGMAIGGIAAGAMRPRVLFAAAPGVAAWATLDKASGRIDGARADVRVPMCSTFKWLLAACVLWHVDRGQDGLGRPVAIGAGALLDYAPTVRAAVEGGRRHLRVEELCLAAVALSDNSAANLLLARIGGPAGLTRWLRGQGDRVTRLDRIEPALNRVAPGDPRDTTTAAAMVRSLDRLLYGPLLAAPSRARLLGWLIACRTGETRLKAGLPAGWRIGHKTGSYTTDHPTAVDRTVAGDVGVLLPPRGQPVLIAAYRVGAGDGDRWFADLARMAVQRRSG